MSAEIDQEARPYINDYWLVLAATSHRGWDEIDVLQAVLAELKYRNQKRARDLRAAITTRLVELSAQTFAWPTTAIKNGNEALRTDHWSYRDGLLSFMGYRVGQKGAYRNERQHILGYVYNETIPRVESQQYMDGWGKPKTGRRLQKLANSIASFARMARRKGSADMGLAISEWEDDLNYLKLRYYDGKHDGTFAWP